MNVQLECYPLSGCVQAEYVVIDLEAQLQVLTPVSHDEAMFRLRELGVPLPQVDEMMFAVHGQVGFN